jgi:hypothetical protein
MHVIMVVQFMPKRKLIFYRTTEFVQTNIETTYKHYINAKLKNCNKYTNLQIHISLIL